MTEETLQTESYFDVADVTWDWTKPEVVFPWQDERLREFPVFLYNGFRFLGFPKPTRNQYAIAEFLQYGDGYNPQSVTKQGICGFRGIAKSTITGFYSSWAHYWWPECKTIFTSATQVKAKEIAHFELNLIDQWGPMQNLRPPKKKGQRLRDSVVHGFDVAHCTPAQAPSGRSVGITATKTGGRANLIVGDDCEVPQNSETANMREKLLLNMGELPLILSPGGKIAYLFTPQSEQTVYGKLPAKGYTRRFWPCALPVPDEKAAEYPDCSPVSVYGSELDPGILARVEAGERPGTPVDERFPQSILDEAKTDLGSDAQWRLQMWLDTRLADADRYPLKLKNLVVMPLDLDMGPEGVVWGGSTYHSNELQNPGLDEDSIRKPASIVGKYVPWQYTVMAIDTSGRGKDQTACCTMSLHNGLLYHRGQLAYRGGYEDPDLELVWKEVQRLKVHKIVLESQFGGDAFKRLLETFFLKRHPDYLSDEKTSHRALQGVSGEAGYLPSTTGRHEERGGYIFPAIETKRAVGQKEVRICDTLAPIVDQHHLIVDEELFHRDLKPIEGIEEARQIEYRMWYQFTRVTRERGCLVHDDNIDSMAMAADELQASIGDRSKEAIEGRQEDERWQEIWDVQKKLLERESSGNFTVGDSFRHLLP